MLNNMMNSPHLYYIYDFGPQKHTLWGVSRSQLASFPIDIPFTIDKPCTTFLWRCGGSDSRRALTNKLLTNYY